MVDSFLGYFRVENEERENKKEKGNWRWQEMGRKKEEGDAGKGW